MKPTQTAIAVGLAIVVVVAVFLFPRFSPFGKIGGTAQSQASQTATSSASAAATEQTTTAASTTSNTMTTADGLQITDEVVGTGATAEPGDTVTVSYVGTLTNGTIFDASANHAQTKNGFSFQLGAGHVIRGWDEGVVGMKVGGKRKLVIPPALAYGNQSVGGGLIPPNSTLIFEIELLSVQKPAGQ